MKIALKIVVVCLVAMVLITALSSYLIARREFVRIKELQQSDARRVASLVRESLDVAYQGEGHEGIVKAIKTQTVETGSLRYRWVWFDVSVNDPNRPAASMDSLEKILAGDMDSVTSIEGGSRKLFTYYPMEVKEDSGQPRKGAIEIRDSLETAEQEAFETVMTGLGAIALMAIFCFTIVAWAGVRLIGRPLSSLIDQTRRIGEGDYEPSATVGTRDEFGELSNALNEMATKISDQQQRIASESAAKVATLEQLRHADRLKTVGRLASGLAHEIGTPLNVVSGRAGLIRSGKLNPEEIAESAAAIQSESNRIAGIVRQLMDFARHNPPTRAEVDLRVIVERTVDLLKTLADKSEVEIEIAASGDPPFTAFVDESQMQQVLTNLIVNAIQAMPEGGKIEVVIENTDEAAADQRNANGRDANEHDAYDGVGTVKVTIKDHGIGMDAKTVEHIFEPFFTTKEVGKGTGLGLSIAHGIIEEHGGQIEVESSPGEGTKFVLWIPKKINSTDAETKSNQA